VNRSSCACCLLVALAVLAGCGGDSGTTDSDPTTSTRPASSEGSGTDKPKKGAWGVVFGAQSEDHGIVLYDLSGHTLYAFGGDEGTTSTCYGACAKTWPPALTEGKPKADGEASPAKVGTTKRKDGTVQLTYAGHPLYTYAPERGAEVRGNGRRSFGGEWYAIRPDGEPL
jgi:predicted lipoprotein with Yx(FWY)xxD motif